MNMKKIIALGLISGIIFTAASAKHTLAAVAVIDEQNIAEAIKTAINTATMLTTEQKQLALQVLNMRTVNAETLLKFLKTQEKVGRTVWNEQESMTGALNPNKSVAAFWTEEIGSVEEVLNGNKTVYDMYQMTDKRLRALNKTNQDAARLAKTAQELNKDLSEQVTNGLISVNEAEGNMEAQQGQAAIAAANAQSMINSNMMLSGLAAAMTAKYQQEAYEKAVAHQLDASTKDNLKKWVNSFD
jgi:hypothetical protein